MMRDAGGVDEVIDVGGKVFLVMSEGCSIGKVTGAIIICCPRLWVRSFGPSNVEMELARE